MLEGLEQSALEAQKGLCVDPRPCRHGSGCIVASDDLKLAANFEW